MNKIYLDTARMLVQVAPLVFPNGIPALLLMLIEEDRCAL
jgi:hypothetical protein